MNHEWADVNYRTAAAYWPGWASVKDSSWPGFGAGCCEPPDPHRRARSDDVEVLLSIQRASAVEAFPQVFPPERYPFPDDEVRAAWTEALASHDVQTFIAESRGTSVGFVAIEGDYLRTLYVIPTAQRQGVGGALIDFAIERLKASGVRTAKLWTLEANARARSFYERRGWRLTDETRKVAFPPYPLDVGYEKAID
jgi:GNAT superfamily N-acetyltransferase